MKMHVAAVLGLVISVFLGGCAGNQPIPQVIKKGKLKRASGKKGMLYVYRPSSFIGAAVYYDIHDGSQNNKVLGTITSGSVVASELNPGYREIWAETEARVGAPVSINRGATQCVKAGVGFGLFVGRPTLQKVDLQTCQYDIKKIIDERKKQQKQREKEKNRKDRMGLPR